MLRRVRQSLRQVLLLMARRPDLLCGAIVLSALLILAVKFTCSRAKDVVAAARPPVRFFSAEAPVVDLYLGQLDQVERLRSMAEVSLIFFYAPWCAHSMAARQEVQQVAKKLAKQVQFVAVNCWWSQGRCRRQNRFYHYPIIHLFYRRFGPIEYRGPFVAPYIESFTLRVITPLTYLPTRAHLEDFLSYHEPGVVGFFQFNSSPQPPGYITYLSSALQALRRDFHGIVRFGVVTSKNVAETISVGEDETVYLHRKFNSSLTFPRNKRNFTSDAICSWVFEHYQTALRWLHPPGTKSRMLEEELMKGPALLLFMPHNPLQSEPSAVLQQFADIAVRYHSCDRSSSDDHFPSLTSLCCQSVLLPESRTNICEVCLRLSGPSLPNLSTLCSFPSVSQGNTYGNHIRHCCLHQLPSPISIKTSEGCSYFVNSYSPFTQFSACCKTVEPQLNESKAKEELTSPPAPSIAPSLAPQLEDDGITGLQCRTNRTLRFYVLDVGLSWPLAARLGASSYSNSSQHKEASTEGGRNCDGSFVAIVNLKDEVHYVLQRSPAATLTESLEAFIRNFSSPHSHLQRYLVGDVDRKKGGDHAGHLEKEKKSKNLLITELTTSSFMSSVMDQEKDVLLFYYTQWCGFCSVLNHVLIQLARLLQGNGTVTVARVNVARNDLPWEFMVDHVPSILLFPKYRKHLSVKYPEDLPITLPNLLRFILQHSDSLHHPNRSSSGTQGSRPGSILQSEFLALQREVQALHHARKRLSQQLAELWRKNRQLKFDMRSVEQNLEKEMQEKSRQLAEAHRRLQELADTSETLLNENVLLKVLLRALKDRTEPRGEAEAEKEETVQEKKQVS
ncbi:PREDICTED: thioredoxin domain-containing protein 11 [Cyprinodon variegatus]|uniref:Thioredoxin domain containing 11 n=1 Tax=Cyprinodon variegatus TaxID=28743 RepID=A0A3Q2FWV3_CYPVA|nr:PREDICTED: thioredoxin domain-containing protein 11 [Cyprinodon variegatus]